MKASTIAGQIRLASNRVSDLRWLAAVAAVATVVTVVTVVTLGSDFN